jgi:hypothetical protein
VRSGRTMSLKPKRGIRIPELRFDLVSWKMNGSQTSGTSRTYSTAGRATMIAFATHFTWVAVKW